MLPRKDSFNSKKKTETNPLSDKLNEVVYHIDLAGRIENFAVIIGWVWHPQYEQDIAFVNPETNVPYIASTLHIDRDDVIRHLNETSGSKNGFLAAIDLNINTEFNSEELYLTTSGHILEVELKDVFKELSFSNLLNIVNTFKKETKEEFLSTIYKETEHSSNNYSSKGSMHFHIDGCFDINGHGLFIEGWMDDYNKKINTIFLKSPATESKNLLPKLSRKARPDVNKVFPEIPADYKVGFFVYIEYSKLKISQEETASLEVLVVDHQFAITTVPVSVSSFQNNLMLGSERILSNWDPLELDSHATLWKNTAPALQHLWSKSIKPPTSVKSVSYGSLPTDPDISIIVPLYGRCDFVMHQLLHFSGDEDFKSIELIYVLDDPSLEIPLIKLAEENYRLFDIPFKIILPGKNLGFANANNVGARESRGELLLLLNSDVFPSSHGWAGKLKKIYQNLKNPGALGVKLIYEDQSLQHIGMKHEYSTEYKLFLNSHPYKGYPPTLVPKTGTKITDCVTAACLMVSRSKYTSASGLDPAYLLGDFEDSDFCMKFLKEGYENYVTDEVTMYHLERQSQSLVTKQDWKHKMTLYNANLHHKRWHSFIKEKNSFIDILSE